MTEIASATLKAFCDEAGEMIRAMEPRRMCAEVVSVRPSGRDLWTTVMDGGDCVDVLIPGSRLSGRTPQVKRGMVLDMYVQAKPQRAEPAWFCVALHARMTRPVGPFEEHRDRMGRVLAAQGVIRRRKLDARQYSSIRGVEGARRITAGQVPGGGVAVRAPFDEGQAVSAGRLLAPISGSVVGTMLTRQRARTSRPR